MPASISITSPTAAWAKIDRELAEFPKELRAGKYQAVKKTATQGRNMIFSRFKEQYPRVQKSKIESGDLTKRRRPIVSDITGGSENPQGNIRVRDYKIPMIAFGPTGPGSKIPSMGRPGGVTVTMDKSKGATTYKHAFKAKLRSGHVGIFLRKIGKRGGGAPKPGASPFAGRTPIRELYGPSMYDLVDVPAINAEVIANIDGILAKNIESQLKFRKAKVGIL